MRDPERIDQTLKILEAYWKQNPDMRLTQILWNARKIGPDDRSTISRFYNMEDEDLSLRIAGNIYFGEDTND